MPDFPIIVNCINMPGHGARAECKFVDLNVDHRIDDVDFRLFSEAVGFPPGPSAFAP